VVTVGDVEVILTRRQVAGHVLQGGSPFPSRSFLLNWNGLLHQRLRDRHLVH
jgi:hypothetical protein